MSEIHRDKLVELFRKAPMNACFTRFEMAALFKLSSASHITEVFDGYHVEHIKNFTQGRKAKVRYPKSTVIQLLKTRTVDFKHVTMEELRSELL